jgi:hypothetical protein
VPSHGTKAKARARTRTQQSIVFFVWHFFVLHFQGSSFQHQQFQHSLTAAIWTLIRQPQLNNTEHALVESSLIGAQAAPHYVVDNPHDSDVVNLTPQEWRLCHQVEITLQTMAFWQRVLEGEKYVTGSLVPLAIYTIRQTFLVGRSVGRPPHKAPHLLNALHKSLIPM